MYSIVKYINAGQVCTAPNTFYVQEEIYDEFVRKMKDYVSGLKIGHGLDDGKSPIPPKVFRRSYVLILSSTLIGVTLGALTKPAGVERVQTLIQEATSKGARLLHGGHKLPGKGNLFEATLLVDVPKEAKIYREEIFGPVCVIARFNDLDEIVREARERDQGLVHYVWTSVSTDTRHNVLSHSCSLSFAVTSGPVGAWNRSLILFGRTSRPLGN